MDDNITPPFASTKNDCASGSDHSKNKSLPISKIGKSKSNSNGGPGGGGGGGSDIMTGGTTGGSGIIGGSGGSLGSLGGCGIAGAVVSIFVALTTSPLVEKFLSPESLSVTTLPFLVDTISVWLDCNKPCA